MFAETLRKVVDNVDGGIAAVIMALLVINGAALVHKIESYPFTLPGLLSDTTVDRERIARSARDDLRRANLPPGASLRFWSPTSIRIELGAHPDSDPLHRETYWERNVRTALSDGLGVRVLFPAVREKLRRAGIRSI